MLLPVQIALSMVLLVCAGLFSLSLSNLRAADLGIDRENVLLADVRAAGRTPQENGRFWTRMAERISVLPGVRSAALGGDAVFGNGGWNQTVWIQHPGQPDQHVNVSHNVVSPGFFATVGIPVLVGREFTERDNDGAPLVALVNQTFARRYFGSENPIGRRFGDRGRGSGGRYEIVGVVGDAKYGSVREKTRAMVFQPLLQETPRGSLVLHLRGWERPAPLAKSIRREMLAIDGNALMSDVRTLPQVIHIQLRQDRMLAMLGSFFAALALALAAIGIYGVVAYGVAHRTSEIGVRIALGAQRADVLSLVMKETLVLVAIGGILGTASALAVSSVIRKMLFGLRPSDPATLVIAGVVLLTAGILACVVPARRAASLDPVDALRAE